MNGHAARFRIEAAFEFSDHLTLHAETSVGLPMPRGERSAKTWRKPKALTATKQIAASASSPVWRNAVEKPQAVRRKRLKRNARPAIA